MKKILISGYFDRGNLGDDLFKNVWQYLFKMPSLNQHNVLYISLDDLRTINLTEYDMIILAGGDILNYYFLVELRRIIKVNDFKGQLYAFSIGIPYNIVIVDGLLHEFNFFICRSISDACALRRHFGEDHVRYFPDISVYLPQICFKKVCHQCSPEDQTNEILSNVPHISSVADTLNKNKFNIGVFLTRTIFKNNAKYEIVINNLAKSIDKIIEMEIDPKTKKEFEVHLIPFNTFKKNIFEDDNLINNDLFNVIKYKDKVKKITEKLDVKEMNNIFINLDMCITMRYHSHMYAIVNNIPFVSIYTTRKVQNLLNDTKLVQYSYKLPLNEDDLPINFEVSKFIDKFTTVLNNRNEIVIKMKQYISQYVSFEQFEETIGTLINNPAKDQVCVKTKIFSINTINDVIESLVKYIWMRQKKNYTDDELAIISEEIYKDKLNFYDLLNTPTKMTEETVGIISNESSQMTNQLESESKCETLCENPSSLLRRVTECEAKEHVYSPLVSFQNEEDFTKLSDFLASLACFGLIHIPYPKYHYGMAQKILTSTFKAKNDFIWVWGDYQLSNEKFFIENPIIRKPYFNATFVGIEDLKGCHRSGWQYVINNLMAFHTEKSDLIFAMTRAHRAQILERVPSVEKRLYLLKEFLIIMLIVLFIGLMIYINIQILFHLKIYGVDLYIIH